jgi:hypothetical protein
MAIRLHRSVLTDGHIDIGAWQVAVGAGISVGQCDCGGPANGERIILGRRLTWATAVCVQCGADAPRPVVASAAGSNSDEPAGVPATTSRRGLRATAERIVPAQRRRRRTAVRRP